MPTTKPVFARSEKSLPRNCSGAALIRFLFGFLAVFDDVALLEKNPLRDLFPLRLGAKEPFEVHREMFELFLLRVLHDRSRALVFFDRDALLVPVNRLGFLA